MVGNNANHNEREDMKIKVYVRQKDETNPIAGLGGYNGMKNLLTIEKKFGSVSWSMDPKLTVKEAAIIASELTREGRLFGNITQGSEGLPTPPDLTKSHQLVHIHVSAKPDIPAHPDFKWFTATASGKPRRSIGTVWSSKTGTYFFTLQKDITPGEFAYICQEVQKGKEGCFYTNGFVVEEKEEETGPTPAEASIGPSAEWMEGAETVSPSEDIPF